MIDLQRKEKLQISFINSQTCQRLQFGGLKKAFSLNDQIQNINQLSSCKLGENSFSTKNKNSNNDLQRILEKCNEMSEGSQYIGEQFPRILKKTSSMQLQKLNTQQTFTNVLTQDKEIELKIKTSLQENLKQQKFLQNKHNENQINNFSAKRQKNTKQISQSFQPNWELQSEVKFIKISQQTKINQTTKVDNKNTNQKKKLKSRHQTNKQNSQEQMVSTKRTKSIKKVAFESLTNQSPKQENKSVKNLTETSIKIDQTGSQVQSNYLQFKNSTRSLRMTSEHGTYRLLKMAGSQQNQLKLIVKQIEIKSNQIQVKQQQLFRISSEIRHPNILKMYSKNKIIRQNKTYLQIKMDFYQNNLVNYFIMNHQSSTIQIQRKIILFQVIKAINFLHFKKIYHRDINPFNIMIGDRLKVALTNFAYVQNTYNGQFSKSNFYQCNSFIRPPQIILNPLRSFDKGGDIWALGCTIVFMLKGDLPFKDYSDAEMIIQMMKFLGKSSKQYLQSINFKNNKRFIFPDLPRLSMKKFFKCEDNSLLEILQSIFIFQSDKRQTSQNLLASKYFDELRDQIKYKNLQKDYQIDSLFDFSNQMLDNKKKKQIVPKWYKSQ